MKIKGRLTLCERSACQALLCGQKGFSYIEALIAAALLSIMLVPVLAGFLQSKRNSQFAMDVYRADLLAKSLLLDSQKAVRLGRWGEADSFEAWIDGLDDIYDRDSFDYAVFVQPIGDLDGGFALSTHGGSIEAPALSGDTAFMLAPVTVVDGYDEAFAYDNGFITHAGSIAEVEGDRCRLLYVGDTRVRFEVGRCERDLTVDIHNPYNHVAALDIYVEERAALGHIKIKYSGHAGTIVRFFDHQQFEVGEPVPGVFVIAVEVLTKDGKLLRRLEGV